MNMTLLMKRQLPLSPPTHTLFPLETPLPQTKIHRLRVHYASKRMERLNKKGLGELSEEVDLFEDEEVKDESDELDGDVGEIC